LHFHQRFAPSWEIHRPPSSPVTTCFGFFGLIQTSWWSPCVPPPTSLKLSPPSSDAMSVRFGL
jgi:hypothetical protein